MEQLQIIPFGKYKGQPIDVLQSDKQYADWLMQQDWFREKYPQFNTVIINNFNAPQDSPEHNKLASLFLNDEFCINLFKFCNSHVTSKHRITKTKHHPKKVPAYAFNAYAIDCDVTSIEDKGYSIKRTFEAKEGSDILIEVTKTYILHYYIQNKDNNLYSEVSFFKPGFGHYMFAYRIKQMTDILIETTKEHYEVSTAAVEIKPVVGDDYPTVMRQCRAQKSSVLFIGEFKSSVISINDLRKMFPDIQIVLLSDINTEVINNYQLKA